MNESIQSFFRYMFLYLSSNLDILSSIRLVKNRIKNKKLKNVIDTIIVSIEAGKPTIESFSLLREKQYIDSVAWSIVVSSYKAGRLSDACFDIAEYQKKKSNMKRSFISSMAYPIGIILSSLAMIYFLLFSIFPKIVPLFVSMHMPLPFSTRLLLALTNTSYLSLIFGTILVAVFSFVGFIYFVKNEKWRLLIERIFFMNLVSKKIFMIREYYRLSLSLSVLLKNGTDITEALSVSGSSSPFLSVSKSCIQVSKAISSGLSLSTSFEKEKIFEHDWIHIVAVGERTGSLPTVFADLSVFYERHWSDRLQLLARWSEPLSLGVSAGIILIVALSVIQPMYSIIQFMHT